MSEATLAARCRRLSELPGFAGGGFRHAQESEVRATLLEAAETLEAIEPRAPLKSYPWPARAAVIVMAVSGAWLVMGFIVVAVAFIVSRLGGDLPGLLIGLPAAAVLAAACVLALSGWWMDPRRKR